MHEIPNLPFPSLNPEEPSVTVTPNRRLPSIRMVTTNPALTRNKPRIPPTV